MRSKLANAFKATGDSKYAFQLSQPNDRGEVFISFLADPAYVERALAHVVKKEWPR